MKVKCRARDPLNGEVVTYTEDINTMGDYERVRSAMIGSSHGYIDDYQIVKDGFITEDAYNNAKGILKIILNG